MSHRIGSVAAGENIVSIHVASPHRKEAFQACEWLIDELQNHIWKKKSLKLVSHGKQGWVDIMKKEIEGIIDISEKKLVKRVATATGQLKLSKPSIDAINANKVRECH